TDIDMVSKGHWDGDELLSILAGIENHSEHPLADAIVSDLRGRGVSLVEVSGFQAIPGKGARATYQDKTYYVGNERLFTELGIDITPVNTLLTQRHAQGKSTVLFGSESEVLAVIALADTVRERSRWVVN